MKKNRYDVTTRQKLLDYNNIETAVKDFRRDVIHGTYRLVLISIIRAGTNVKITN